MSAVNIRMRNRRRKLRALLLGVGLLTGAAAVATASHVTATRALPVEGWEAAQRGPAGKDLNAVFFADSKRGWVGGDDGLVLRTEDGGRTWARQLVETRDAVSDIYFRDKEDGYLLAGNTIFGTEDGGRAWRQTIQFSPASFGGAVPDLYSVRFVSKKRGWVVGSLSRRDRIVDSLVLYTEDAGTSWQRQRVPTQAELIHLDFSGEKRGWIVGASGVIIHTENGGETWARQTTNTNATLYHVDFRNERDGWAVGERGTILRTENGGATWASVVAPVRNTLLSAKFAGERDGWIVGRGGVILRSEDGGATWLQQESRTKQNLYALFLDKKNNWAVGGDGIILQYGR